MYTRNNNKNNNNGTWLGTKFRWPVCQIPRLTTANLPHIVINFVWPLNPKPDQICSICRQ